MRLPLSADRGSRRPRGRYVCLTMSAYLRWLRRCPATAPHPASTAP